MTSPLSHRAWAKASMHEVAPGITTIWKLSKIYLLININFSYCILSYQELPDFWIVSRLTYKIVTTCFKCRLKWCQYRQYSVTSNWSTKHDKTYKTNIFWQELLMRAQMSGQEVGYCLLQLWDAWKVIVLLIFLGESERTALAQLLCKFLGHEVTLSCAHVDDTLQGKVHNIHEYYHYKISKEYMLC